MQKQADPDPRHKALKQHKKNWNKAMKELILRMKAFQKALNGKGDHRYALPTSKLHEPIPPELINFINTLSTNYEAVASEALKITTEQNEFARGRQQAKAQPKVASLQLEASNKLTRLWQYIKSPFLSEENKKLRIGLLRSLAKMEILFEEFEGNILSSGDKSIFKALEKMIAIDAEFGYVYGTFNSLYALEQLDQNKKEKPKPPGNLQPNVSSIAKAEYLIDDVDNLANINGIENTKSMAEFDKLVINFIHEKDTDKKIKLADQIILYYNRMLDNANKLLRKNAPSFAQLFEQTKQQAVVKELNTVASNFLSRWLQKQKHKISPFDRTSGNRIDIALASESCRETLDQLMDTLEDQLDQNTVGSGILELLEKIKTLKIKMAPFHSLVRGKALEKAFDPDALVKMISSTPDDKQVNRLERRFDTLIDNKVLREIL